MQERVTRSVLQSRWLLVLVAAMGIALGVEAALRLDYIVTPGTSAPDFVIND